MGWWIDYKGKGRHRFDLAPGGAQTVLTYVTHPWVFMDKTTNKFMLVTDAKGGTWPYFFPSSWPSPTPLRVGIHLQGTVGKVGLIVRKPVITLIRKPVVTIFRKPIVSVIRRPAFRLRIGKKNEKDEAHQ